ncbi:MAG: VOC family protein [Planctomycetota bacterium]
MDKVCHFEVPYDDKDRMESFYSNVFGWKFFPSPGDVPYMFAITTEVNDQMMPQEAGGINGGTYQRAPEDAPVSRSPVIVLAVDNCEQKIKDIEAAGGSNVMGPQPVGDMGIYAQVKDTEGNIIGLWQALGQG